MTTLASIRVGHSRHVCPRAFCAAAVFIFHCCLSFSVAIWTATKILERCVPGMQQQTAVPQYVRACMSLNRENSKALHSTAKHRAIKYVLIRVRIKISMYVRMLRPVCFPEAWISWHWHVACLHLKCCTIYSTYVCNSNPCLFVSESRGRNRCTSNCSRAQQCSSSMYEHVYCR